MNRGFLLSVLVTIACSDSTNTPQREHDASTDGAAAAPASGGSRGTGGSKSGGTGGTTADASSGGQDAASHGGGNTDASIDGTTGDAAPDAATESGAPPVVDVGASVIERNHRPNRDGAYIEPGLTFAASPKLIRDPAFMPTFTGTSMGSPLYWEKGPGGKGLYYLATTDNNVFAFDETTGAIVWQKNIGQPATKNAYTCGNLLPIGVAGTPVIDPVTETIYVVGSVGATATERFEVHALSIMDGKERSGYPVTLTGVSGGTTFAPNTQNQRGALSLIKGILYVPFGGHSGDCGNYHGWIFAVDTRDPTKIGAWATLGQGEGIWAPGGMASDGEGVFAITGNNTAGATDHMTSDSEQVVRLTGLAVFNRTSKTLYFPKTWRTMDVADADYGSTNPLYLNVPGATPENILVTFSKDGHMYLLDPTNLGGMGGELVDFQITTGGSSVHGVPAAYRSASGVHVLVTTDMNAICPGGTAGTGRMLMQISIPPGSPPKPKVDWCGSSPGGQSGPMVTTTDGLANPIIWFVAGGLLLEGFNGDTGLLAYQGRNEASSCYGQVQWTTPIAVKNRVIVPAIGHMCAWMLPN